MRRNGRVAKVFVQLLLRDKLTTWFLTHGHTQPAMLTAILLFRRRQAYRQVQYAETLCPSRCLIVQQTRLRLVTEMITRIPVSAHAVHCMNREKTMFMH